VLELCVDLVPGGRASPGSSRSSPVRRSLSRAVWKLRPRRSRRGVRWCSSPKARDRSDPVHGAAAVERGAGDACVFSMERGTRPNLVYREDFEAWGGRAGGCAGNPCSPERPEHRFPLETIVSERYGGPDAARAGTSGSAVWGTPFQVAGSLRVAGYDRRAVRYEQW